MIRVGGMTPLTTIDFPGRLAAVLFLQGCPWRCSYCHNPELLPARAEHGLAWTDIEAFLARRHGLLDGVVFSGGEPTMHPSLQDAVARVRSLGYQAALHTGGMYPARLFGLLPLLDWVGLDIKGRRPRYADIVGVRDHGWSWQSLRHVLDSGIAYECRTTWHPDLYPEEELHELADELVDAGVRHWVVQECRTVSLSRARWHPPDVARLQGRFASFSIRRA